MQASWKIRPTLVVVKVLPGEFKPYAALAFRCTPFALQRGGGCVATECHLLLTGDKMQATQEAAQVNLKDYISYDRKWHHPHPAPHFTTSAEINDASFAESCCLGCSGTLPGSALILTPPLPPKRDIIYIQKEN